MYIYIYIGRCADKVTSPQTQAELSAAISRGANASKGAN